MVIRNPPRAPRAHTRADTSSAPDNPHQGTSWCPKRQVTTSSNIATSQTRKLRVCDKTPYRRYGVHSNEILDRYFYYNPIYSTWIVRETGTPVCEYAVSDLEQELARENDLNYSCVDNPHILFYNGQWMPSNSWEAKQARDESQMIHGPRNSGPTPFKRYGVHDNDKMDLYHYYDPIGHYWVCRGSGSPVREATRMEIERELAHKEDLDYRGIQNSNITFRNERWVQTTKAPAQKSNRKVERHANEHVVKTNKVRSTKMCYDTSSVSYEWQQSTMVVYGSRVVDKNRTGGKYKPSVAESVDSAALAVMGLLAEVGMPPGVASLEYLLQWLKSTLQRVKDQARATNPSQG